MSGHSHWSRIKRKKGVTDARRGRLWSKLSRAVIVAAKTGGGDPGQNLALRYAIDKAKQANMPKDTIEGAIKKGTGSGESVEYVTIYYEGYGAGGAAILCEALTDNRNRTAPEVIKIFERNGGNIGAPGCVQWMFSSKGQVTVPIEAADEDKIAELALEGGADDYTQTEDAWEITCEPAAFEAVRETFKAAGIEPSSADLSMVPSSTVTIDASNGRKVLNLVEALEDHEDVQNVHSNFDVPDEVMAALEQ